MIKSLEFYFDFISPYSYLAYKEIEDIKKKKNINIIYKPILLGGLHNLQGITAPAFNKSKLNYMINDCILTAKKKGCDFLWNSKFPINSLSIMRGYFFIEDIKKRNLYLGVMYDAYWKNNLDISNIEILSTLLKKCQIQKDIFLKSIQDIRIKNKLKDATQEAYNREIFGAPTFIVNDKIFWGQDRLEFALDEYDK